MIQRELLATKGTAIGIVALSSEDSEDYRVEEIADKMGIAESTGQQRVDALQEEDILQEGARLVNGEPTSVFSLTSKGERVAEELEHVLEKISADLLKKSGSVVVAISRKTDSVTVASVADSIDTAKSTVRDKIEELREAGIVEQSAELIDDRPKRVFSLTDNGQEIAEHLDTVLA